MSTGLHPEAYRWTWRLPHPTIRIIRGKEYAEVEVFYATDRERGPPTERGLEFTAERKSSEGLYFGKCRVSIPRDHRIGKLETASILTFRRRPNQYVELLRIEPMDQRAYWTDLAATVGSAERQQILVFVHGFLNTFEDAVRRTAQLAYDLQFGGAVVAYSWPSDRVLIPARRYFADETNVEWTTAHFSTFLDGLTRQFPNATIHVVAHSMGSRAVAKAIDIMARSASSARIQGIILAAPDIDAGVFAQLAAAMTKTARRVTLYANSHDGALAASEEIHKYRRAGQSGQNIVIVRGIDTIDASAVDTSLLGHSYHAEVRSVLADMYNLIRLGLEPAKRFGMIGIDTHRGRYWEMKP
jgi:esterase/lipase superfamily enzyme